MDSGDLDSDDRHRQRGGFSDTESQLLAEQEQASLQSLAESLRRENADLRAQFDQAVELTQGMKDLHQKNAKLSAAVRQLQAEKADLSRRLDIATHASEELTTELSNERQSSAQTQTGMIAERDRAISAQKRQHRARVDALELRCKNTEESSEKADLQNRMLLSKIETLTKNASQFFGQTFTDIDPLIAFLSKPQFPVELPTKTGPPDAAQDAKAVAKLKRQRQLLRDARRESESRSSEVTKLQRQLAECEKRQQQQKNSLEARYSQQQDELIAKSQDDAATIEDLASKNERLRNELSSLRRQLQEAPPPPELKQLPLVVPEIPKADPSKGLRDELEKLNDTKAELTQKVTILEQKRRELSEKLAKADKRITELETEFGKEHNQLVALQIVHKEALSEIKTLRESLVAKPDTEAHLQARILCRQLKAQIERLEATVKSQAQDLHAAVIQKETDRVASEKLCAKIEFLKQEVKESQQKVAAISEELATTQAKLFERPILTADSLIPVSAWRFADFGRSLSRQIEQVAVHSVLSPSSKLSQIYRLIHSFYTNELKAKDAELAAFVEDFENAKGIVNGFAIDLSILLQMTAINFDELVNRGGAQKILEKVSRVLSDLEQSRRLGQEYEAVSSHVSNLFGESPDFFAQMADLKAELDDQARMIRTKSVRNRELRRRLYENSSAMAERNEQLTDESAALGRTVGELQESLGHANDTIAQLRSELRAMKFAMREREAAEATLQSVHQSQVDELQSQRGVVEAQLNEHIAQLNGQIKIASETIAAHEAALARLEKEAQANQKLAREKSEQLDEQLGQLESAKDAQIAKLAAQSRAEKDGLTASYEAAVQELRKQCELHRGDLERLAQELAASEAKNRKARTAIVNLKRERMQLENDLANANGKQERDIQVNQAMMKDARLTAQSAASQKMRSAKAKFDDEKRRIFSLAADEFRTFFNAGQQIDERSYRILLARVKAEMKRLADSDLVVRRLVGAAPNQTTHDAVARLVIA
jgi:chromosome segregation ATPase